MPKIYVYAIDPIDHWVGWFTESDFIKSLDNSEFNWFKSVLEDYQAFKQQALDQEHDVGWEGDMGEGPYVAGIPSSGGELRVMMAWKQESNGTTFIASPVKLEYLEADAFAVA